MLALQPSVLLGFGLLRLLLRRTFFSLPLASFVSADFKRAGRIASFRGNGFFHAILNSHPTTFGAWNGVL